MTVVLQRREQKHPGGGQSRDKRGRDYSAVAEKPRKACKHLQTLGRGRKHSPLQVSSGAWPCQYSNFRLLASRTVRGPIAVVLSHPVMVLWVFWAALGNEYNAQILLSLPWKADAKKNIVCASTLYSVFVKHKFLFLQRLKISSQEWGAVSGPPSP